MEDSNKCYDAVSNLHVDSCLSRYDKFGNYTKHIHIPHTEQQHHMQTFIFNATMYHTFNHDILTSDTPISLTKENQLIPLITVIT